MGGFDTDHYRWLAEVEETLRKAKRKGLRARWDIERGVYVVEKRRTEPGKLTEWDEVAVARTMVELSAKVGGPPPPQERYDGETTSQEDAPRLNAQMARVHDVLRDGEWHTLRDIAETTGDPEASISARIRDLRKPKFGAYDVLREKRGNGWHYRMVREAFEPTQQRLA